MLAPIPITEVYAADGFSCPTADMADSEPLLRLGGLTPLSSTDYPGQLSAVLFCQGCPWRCSYCQNEHLLPASTPASIAWPDAMRFVQSRRGLLDAVVFSGGEPTAQAGLMAASRQIRDMGFKIGLHTGGAYPKRLGELLSATDWVGLDYKTTDEHYADLTGSKLAAQQFWQSLKLLLDSGVRYEIRTTVHWHLLSRQQLRSMAVALANAGVRHYAVQLCLTRQGLAKNLVENAGTSSDHEFFRHDIAPLFDRFSLRY